MAGQGYSLIVDGAGGSDHTTLAAAITAASAGDSIYVRGNQTYSESPDVTKALHVRIEPKTTFTAFTQSAKSSVLWGNGCTVTNAYTMSAAGCWMKARNGMTTGGMVVSAANCFHDGGGWGTTHNGGTARDGINVSADTADDCIFQNCRVQTTAGGATDERGVLTISSRNTFRLIQVVDSDSNGFSCNANEFDHLFEGCQVLDCDTSPYIAGSQRVRILGMHIAGNSGTSTNHGILINSNADNTLVVGCVIQSCSGNEIDIDGSGEDCVIVSNRVFGVIKDSSGTSTAQYNDLGTASIAVTGTVISEQPAGLLDSEIRAGGKTLIFTITNGSFRSDTDANLAANWRAFLTSSTGGDFDTEKANIIAGGTVAISSNNTVITITFAATAGYENSADETVNIANMDKTVLASEVTITPATTSFVITDT